MCAPLSWFLLARGQFGGVTRTELLSTVPDMDRLPTPIWNPPEMQDILGESRVRLRRKQPCPSLPPAKRRRLEGKGPRPNVPPPQPRITPPRKTCRLVIPADIGSTVAERKSLDRYRGKARRKEAERLTHNRTCEERGLHRIAPLPLAYEPRDPVLVCSDCPCTARVTWWTGFRRQPCGRGENEAMARICKAKDHRENTNSTTRGMGRSATRSFLKVREAQKWCDKHNATAEAGRKSIYSEMSPARILLSTSVPNVRHR